MTTLALLVLGTSGLTFLLRNKLPDKFYEGDGRAARRLRCAFCTGIFVGLIVYPAWGIHAALRDLVYPEVHILLWPSFAGAVGLLAQLVQSVGEMAARASDD